MPFSEAKLLDELDRDEIINWALELKHGKEAYSFLMRSVGTDALNVRQTLNALHALFRIRAHGDSSAVLNLFIEQFTNPVRSIRSEAVLLAIGMVRMSREYDKAPLGFSEQNLLSLRKAISDGLTNKVSSLAAEFLISLPS